MAFWGQGMDSGKSDPKRKFRFKIEIKDLGGGAAGVWYAKTCGKPTINVSADTEHKYLGHTFKFPGSVSWDDIEVTLVDPGGDNDAATSLLRIVELAGYEFPRDTNDLKTISKGKAVEGLQKVHIYQLDGNGAVVERWDLHNPFISKISFGDLDYGDDGLTELGLTLTYDWAELSNVTDGSSLYFEG